MGTPKGKYVWVNSDPYGVEPQWTIKARTQDELSVQFTAEWVETGTLSYLFYNDEGESWKNYED